MVTCRYIYVSKSSCNHLQIVKIKNMIIQLHGQVIGLSIFFSTLNGPIYFEANFLLGYYNFKF